MFVFRVSTFIHPFLTGVDGTGEFSDGVAGVVTGSSTSYTNIALNPPVISNDSKDSSQRIPHHASCCNFIRQHYLKYAQTATGGERL